MRSKTIGTTRIVSFSPEEIFHAFEDADLLARWWGPDGFTNTFHEFDFQPGGKWTHVMHGPNGIDYPNEAVFRITNIGHIVIEHISHPHFTLSVMFMAREG